MDHRAKISGLVLATLLAGAAHAQFNLDVSPSGMRATAAKANADAAKDLGKQPGLHPLSPLGGRQGTPLTIQPATPTTAVQAYAGTPSAASPAPALGLDGKPLPSDPSMDDPTKPRRPLKPKSLAQGVAPR